jgi:hypothetical protein
LAAEGGAAAGWAVVAPWVVADGAAAGALVAAVGAGVALLAAEGWAAASWAVVSPSLVAAGWVAAVTA